MDEDASWRSTSIGCGAYLLIFVAIVCTGAVWSDRDFDPDRRCPPGKTGSCFSVGTGSVESSSGDHATVRYDDGRRIAAVTVDGDVAPPAGSRVRLEWWEDEIVALYELRHERRYRTLEWPDPWWEWALFFAFCAAAIGIVLGAVFGIAALVGRVRAPRREPL